MFLPSWTGVNGKPLNTQDCFYMTDVMKETKRWDGEWLGGYALHWVGWPGKDSPRRWDFNWDLKTEKESDMQHSERRRNKLKVSRKFIHLSNIFDHTFNMCWMNNWRINESSFSCQEGPSQERWTYGRCHKLRGKLLPFSPALFHLSNKGLGSGTSIPGLQDLKYSPSKGTGPHSSLKPWFCSKQKAMSFF